MNLKQNSTFPGWSEIDEVFRSCEHDRQVYQELINLFNSRDDYHLSLICFDQHVPHQAFFLSSFFANLELPKPSSWDIFQIPYFMLKWGGKSLITPENSDHSPIEKSLVSLLNSYEPEAELMSHLCEWDEDSVLAAPFMSEGKVIGTMILWGKSLSVELNSLLELLGKQLSYTLDMLALRLQKDEALQQVRKSSFLHEASQSLLHLHKTLYSIQQLSNLKITYQEMFKEALQIIIHSAISQFDSILSMGAFYTADNKEKTLNLIAGQLGDRSLSLNESLSFKEFPSIKETLKGNILCSADSDPWCHQEESNIEPYVQYVIPIVSKRKLLSLLLVYLKDGHNLNLEIEDFYSAVTSPFVGIIERKEAEEKIKRQTEELKKANQDLQQLDKMKTAFLATVSHELRTPLTSILGFSKIIRKKSLSLLRDLESTLESKPRKTINRISDNAEIIISESIRLTSIINDVLDISKMEAGKFEWDIQSHDLTKVLNDGAKAVSYLVENKGLSLETIIPDDLPEVMCDRDRIIQVVINLLSNAIKYTPKGSIKMSVQKVKDFVKVEVTDTGIGIPAEYKDQVFDKFKQLGDTLTDKPPGTGLGLPICKHIIKEHKGQLGVVSEVGVGSTFYFTIPTSLT